MLELLLCSLVTILPDYLYRRYRQNKRFGQEITLYSVWYELRWGITGCLMLTVALITMIFYYHPSTNAAALYFRTVPILPEAAGRVAEVNIDYSAPVKKGAVLFRLDNTKQQAALETAKRKVAEVDASLISARADVVKAEAQSREAQAAWQQARDEFDTKSASGVNAVTGQGLAAALSGADVVVDVANAPSWEPAAVLAFFQRSSENLVAAEAAAGVKHHVALSIVDTDRSPDNTYFRAKLAQETIIKSASVPYSIVRATQFFEFLAAIADTSMIDGKIVVPTAQFQPIAADDVVDRLAEIATGRPLNGTIDIAGPEKAPFNEFIARRLKASADPRPVIGDPKALYYGAPIDDRSLNPLGEARLGATPLATWLSL
ncbi:biotin/lipoyl-binding protein [Bradyrhizobium yuanmingense]|uniref:biotin/lipoyl-binding protein n=1 Tax=Bradyrhizobium yuanmingense TaxID=108015 RepID=UPI000FE35CDA|nr:biotin/lipoyl-binding protein [Bradyrhizobium yuanmingense]TGN89832.1 biotin/lipoyl-binding protein [Bradyrhizobium yuanmingense]